MDLPTHRHTSEKRKGCVEESACTRNSAEECLSSKQVVVGSNPSGCTSLSVGSSVWKRFKSSHADHIGRTAKLECRACLESMSPQGLEGSNPFPSAKINFKPHWGSCNPTSLVRRGPRLKSEMWLQVGHSDREVRANVIAEMIYNTDRCPTQNLWEFGVTATYLSPKQQMRVQFLQLPPAEFW